MRLGGVSLFSDADASFGCACCIRVSCTGQSVLAVRHWLNRPFSGSLSIRCCATGHFFALYGVPALQRVSTRHGRLLLCLRCLLFVLVPYCTACHRRPLATWNAHVEESEKKRKTNSTGRSGERLIRGTLDTYSVRRCIIHSAVPPPPARSSTLSTPRFTDLRPSHPPPSASTPTDRLYHHRCRVFHPIRPSPRFRVASVSKA